MPPLDSETARWFSAAVEPHVEALRRWMRVRFPSVDADDIIQDSLLRVIQTQEQKPLEQPRGYLFRIAHNLALNEIRRDNRREGNGRVEGFGGVIDDNANVREAVCRAQERHLLLEAVQSLPEKTRQALTLRRFYDMPVKDIAAKLGLAEKTVESHITLALKTCADHVRQADQRARAASLSNPPMASPSQEVRHA